MTREVEACGDRKRKPGQSLSSPSPRSSPSTRVTEAFSFDGKRIRKPIRSLESKRASNITAAKFMHRFDTRSDGNKRFRPSEDTRSTSLTLYRLSFSLAIEREASVA